MTGLPQVTVRHGQMQHVRSFKLLGRTDRIVKLEEKRLSLDAIEQSIQALDVVKQCHVLVFEHEQRQMLGCIVVLTEQAREQLQQQGKSAFVSHLKQQLKDGLKRSRFHVSGGS